MTDNTKERKAASKVLALASTASIDDVRSLWTSLRVASDDTELGKKNSDICRCVDHVGSIRFPDWDLVKDKF